MLQKLMEKDFQTIEKKIGGVWTFFSILDAPRMKMNHRFWSRESSVTRTSDADADTDAETDADTDVDIYDGSHT